MFKFFAYCSSKLTFALILVLISVSNSFAQCNPTNTDIRMTRNNQIPLGPGNNLAHVFDYTVRLPDGCGSLYTTLGNFSLYDSSARLLNSNHFSGAALINNGSQTVNIYKSAYVPYSNPPGQTYLATGEYRVVAFVRYYYRNASGISSIFERQFTYTFNYTDSSAVTPTPVITPVRPPTGGGNPATPSASIVFAPGGTGLTHGQTVSGNRIVEFSYGNPVNFNVQSFDLNVNGRSVSQAGPGLRSLSFDTRNVPNGNANVYIRATGVVPSSGQTTYFFSPTVTINIQNAGAPQPTPTLNNNPLPEEDRTFPGISITLNNNQTVSGILNFSVTASDNVGLKSLAVFGFGSRLLSKDFANFPAESLLYTHNFTIDTSKYPNGVYEINVTAIDKNSIGRNPNGNASVSVRVITVNNTGTPAMTPAPEITPPPTATATPAPQPGGETLDTLVNMLSQLIAQLTELIKSLLKTPAPDAAQANIAKSMVNSLAELTSVNEAQLESMEQTKDLPSQAKNMKKSINKALKRAQKKNDKSALKDAKKEMNKANRQFKKLLASLK